MNLPPPHWEPSDAAKRCSDAVNLHILADSLGAIGKWVAIRLSDGGSDGVLYDTKSDAVRSQLHERQCAYVCVTPDGMSPRAAESYLKTVRRLYDEGVTLSDPADVKPNMYADQAANPALWLPGRRN
jgi:hypothetical protein